MPFLYAFTITFLGGKLIFRDSEQDSKGLKKTHFYPILGHKKTRELSLAFS